MTKVRLVKLPALIETKIYKTGQTRGADDDVIYQNRVNRNSTVLIDYLSYERCLKVSDNDIVFENGFIVLINPTQYFTCDNFVSEMKSKGLVLGLNSLLFYETRDQWNKFNPDEKNFTMASSRNPLTGHYVARVSSTTSSEDERINRGFTTSGSKGAGIRVYEYASKEIMKNCRVQLEYLYWQCFDSNEISLDAGMSKEDIEIRQSMITNDAKNLGLTDMQRLRNVRIVDVDGNTICPLCLEKLSARGFYSKVEQAEGRSVHDLTVTQLNLFHIKELRTGEYNHKPYNLGWGHHHCNVVTKDAGIFETLKWMADVISRNEINGFTVR